MFLWVCSGHVRHAVDVGTDVTACGIPLDRLRVVEYDKDQTSCERCEERVKKIRDEKILEE